MLFVDDEPNVLNALQRMLRKSAITVSFAYACGGEAALDECSRSSFDIVVSDMKMPGMDGAALMARLHQQYPQSVRVVLSGHSDLGALSRALPFIHRYLGKPCAPEVSTATIADILALRALLGDSPGQTAAASCILPVHPDTYADLLTLLHSGGGSPEAIAAIARRDLAMSLRLLQLANSALTGNDGALLSVEAAVGRLGTSTLESLVLEHQVFRYESSLHSSGIDLRALASEGIRVGRIAARIAAQSGATAETIELALTAGALHDIGRLLTHAVPEPHPESIDSTNRGAYVLGLLGLPRSLVNAVLRQHDRNTLQNGLPLDKALYLALHPEEPLNDALRAIA